MWLGRTMARPYRWRKVATGGRFRQVAVQGDEVSHPHTAGTSGTTCVVLTKIVPLRGTDSLHTLWLGRTMARPNRWRKVAIWGRFRQVAEQGGEGLLRERKYWSI